MIRDRLSRPFLIVVFRDDMILATAQRVDVAADRWEIRVEGGDQPIVATSEHDMNSQLDALSRRVAAQEPDGGTKYDRDDPETGEPLPCHASGYPLGSGPGRRRT